MKIYDYPSLGPFKALYSPTYTIPPFVVVSLLYVCVTAYMLYCY